MVPQDSFAHSGRYIKPDTIEANTMREQIYTRAIFYAQAAYKELLDSGLPMEDARQVLPLAATQSITWTLSLKALQHIIGKRACWIAQYGLWGNIIRDMVNEMCEKVHPLFRSIIQPPCFEKGKFKSCPIEMVNLDRVKGTDPYPPCPMWENHATELGTDQTTKWQRNFHTGKLQTDDLRQAELMTTMKDKFRDLWQLDPTTGEPIQK